MADESYSFSTARTRLEEIVSQVRKKDTSLEKSLDLLEEGVRLANACTELIDHQDWVSTAAPDQPDSGDAEPSSTEVAEDDSETIVVEGVAVIEDVIIEDDDGNFVAEVIEVNEFDSVADFGDADDAWAEEATADDAQTEDDPSAAER
jgi:exodeoxyribonuclease VII small subunit